jgi:hypothetical protein
LGSIITGDNNCERDIKAKMLAKAKAKAVPLHTMKALGGEEV